MSGYKIGSIVTLTEDSKDARFAHALKSLNAIITERDALRAELAAAKKRADGLEEHIKGLREGTLAREAYRQRDEAFRKVDAAEAELAAAKAKMQEGEGDCRFCRDLEGDSKYPCTCGWTYGALATAYGNALQERTALAAHVERLKKALKGVCKLRKKTEATHQAAYEAMFKLPGRKAFEDAAEAIAAAPAMSLAAHDAAVKVAVLREVAGKLRNEESANSSLHAEFVEAEAVQIKANADRIAKEAANG